MKTKLCPRCKEVKSVDNFHKDNNRKGGLCFYCKSCHNEIRRVNYELRVCPICKIEFIPKTKRSVTCGSNKCMCKRYRENNYDKCQNYEKLYHEKNREKYIEYNRKYRIENKEQFKEYRIKNRKRTNEYMMKRRKENPQIKIADSLRKRINKLVKKKNKSKSTLELLGCSLDEFLNHLEELFQDGMSFDNYGKWHIDHILPCSAFDLENSEEQEICFHYTNLQPLWAKENISKSNKID
jgi:hypothetical protein